MDLHAALELVRPRHHGVLTTVRRNGRPQLSNIMYGLGADDVVRISVTDGRAKTRNLRRDDRASLYVPGDDFWAYVVVDGTVELSPVAADPDDDVVDELIAVYRHVSGTEHPDWDDYRRAMVSDRRLVIRLRPDHAYGMVPPAGT